MGFDGLRWQSLTTKVTLFTLAIFVLSIAALALFASRLLRQDLERLLGEQQFSTVSLTADRVGAEVAVRFSALRRIADEIGPDLMGDARALQERLAQRPIIQDLFNGGIFITGPDGTTLAGLPVAAGRLGINYMAMDHIAIALKRGKAALGRPLFGQQTRAPIVGMAVPIRNEQGDVIGALAGVIDLSKPNFLDQIIQTRYGRTGGFLLITPEYRQIVTATDKKRIMEVLPVAGINAYVDRNIAGYEGYSVLVNPLGEQQLASVKQIPEIGWYVLLGTPTLEAFAPIDRMEQRVLVATLVLTLLAGALTWWILRRALTPLVMTAQAMTELSMANRIPANLPVTSQDEIGQLTGSFNRLIKTWTQREAVLKKSEQDLAVTLNSIADAVMTTDLAGHISGMNPTAERLSGWRMADALGHPLADVFHILNSDTREIVPDPVQLVRAQGQVVPLPSRTVLLAKDGQEYQISDKAAPIRNGAGDITGVVLVFSDVTEKHQAQTALKSSEQDYKSLLENLSSGVVVHRPDSSIMLSNPMAATLLGLTREQLLGRMAMDPAWSFLQDNGSPMPLQDYPVNRVIASGERLLNYVVGVSHPGGLKPTWVICNAYPMLDAKGQLLHVVVTFTDITERKQVEQREHDLALRVERAMLGTVDAVSKMVDLRDPYTAGHERRVGEVAAAIAAEMGLDADMQRGLRVAGKLHDVGKITVPAEILSKPGKLSALQYAIIQGHAAQGYEVLSGIDFPWPVAEVAYQHHERIDGSGYPRGLKGAEIVLEARILAVADVVEAMSSDRPYRPGAGIERAVAEIELGRGTIFDADVTDACLRLFRDKAYTIPG